MILLRVCAGVSVGACLCVAAGAWMHVGGRGGFRVCLCLCACFTLQGVGNDNNKVLVLAATNTPYSLDQVCKYVGKEVGRLARR